MEKKIGSVIEYIKNNGVSNVQIDYPEFLNSKVHGFHKSRYIASWINVGGTFDHRFKEWLLAIEFDDGHMSEDEADEIDRFARGGKFEFERSAVDFMKK